MRLCCAALVANECDIIEAFARHALLFADHLHIQFHNSYDSSQDIVRRLIADGHRISTGVIHDPAFRRERLGDDLVRSASAIAPFDYILPLDADEFIVANSRVALEAELDAAPSDGALSVAWLSYVPTATDTLADPNPLTRIRRRLRAPHPNIRKVFFRADLLQRFDDVVLADGNHSLLSKSGRALLERRSTEVWLAHFPVRSPGQLASKTMLGALARQISPEFTEHQSRHWRSLARDDAFISQPSWERVSEVARSYLGEVEDAALIDAPLDTPIKALRYPELIAVDPFARLARCVTALAESGALRPPPTSGNTSDGAVALPDPERQKLLSEVDTARRLVQKLHNDIAEKDAIIGWYRREQHQHQPAVLSWGEVPPRPELIRPSAGSAAEPREISVTLNAPVAEGDDLVLSAHILGVSERPCTLWYRIPAERAPDELAIAHAFTISLINTAMAVNRALRINGPLSRGLLLNLEEYQNAWSRWMPDRFHQIAIIPREIVVDDVYRPELGFLLPFSGGLDSMHAAWVLHQQGRLGALASLHGLDIPLRDTTRWAQTRDRFGLCAQSIHVPHYSIATNWETMARDLPGYLGYFLPILAAGVLVGRGYGGVISSSSFPYDHLFLPLETNPITDPLLGRPSMPILHWGAAAHRIDKVAAIADWPQALETLRPCDECLDDGRACGRCRKCVHTALAFLALGRPVPEGLGGRTPAIADIERFEASPYSILSLRDTFDNARRRNISGDWMDAIERRLNAASGPTVANADAPRLAALTREVNELRRRLDYVVGGMHRSLPQRRARQTLRALRGMTGPRDLPRAIPSLHLLPEVADAPGMGTNVIETEGGCRIYVDASDMRGAALLAAKGNLKPAALRMWQQLVAERDWTHIVDVGANYGEMLVGIDAPAGARLIAVEPNPHICWHLERTLRDARLDVEIVRKAVSDTAGAVDLIVNRTWSGMTAITVDRRHTVGHRMEPIRVDAVTLADLFARETVHAMHALFRIDVEGHQVRALKGLAGLERQFRGFAALIELTQLTSADIAWLLESYCFEVLAAASGRLEPARVASPHELSRLFARGEYHVHDVVVRLRAS